MNIARCADQGRDGGAQNRHTKGISSSDRADERQDPMRFVVFGVGRGGVVIFGFMGGHLRQRGIEESGFLFGLDRDLLHEHHGVDKVVVEVLARAPRLGDETGRARPRLRVGADQLDERRQQRSRDLAHLLEPFRPWKLAVERLPDQA